MEGLPLRGMEVAVVGGGAAGFFLAVHLKLARPEMRVVVLERAQRVLAKVKVSGGGRCNLTNTFEGVEDLCRIYPRGFRLLKRLFRDFGPQDAFAWFEERGVPLVAEVDGCVFPRSQRSESIILCLQGAAREAGVEVLTGHGVASVRPRVDGRFEVNFADGKLSPMIFDKVAVTTGGAPRAEGHGWLSALGHRMEPPCPSLYTFNIKEPQLQALMGIVAERAQLAIAGTKFRSEGALLVTHWGLSGPAALRLSSYAARHLAEHSFRVPLLVNWMGETDVEAVRAGLQELTSAAPRRQLATLRPYGLQARLWEYLLHRAGFQPSKPCGELGRKGLCRLADILTADRYEIAGRAACREEFVTCGGVGLDSVSPRTLESRHVPGLYFAGEVLDIDAVTGGFNFQAAWTTAYVAARAMAGTES